MGEGGGGGVEGCVVGAVDLGVSLVTSVEDQTSVDFERGGAVEDG